MRAKVWLVLTVVGVDLGVKWLLWKRAFALRPPKSESRHPFLLLRKEDLPILQKQAEISPWKEMAVDARNEALGNPYTDKLLKGDYLEDCLTLTHILSVNALSYILDPGERNQYKANILGVFSSWISKEKGGSPDNLFDSLYRDKVDWLHQVPPGSAFFHSLLAFDIIYNDLNVEERTETIRRLAPVGVWYARHKESHQESFRAVRGTWALFQGDHKRIDEAQRRYREHLFRRLTPDGVYNAGPGYAGFRLGQSMLRSAKTNFIDVLEFSGADRSYYNDPTLQKAQEWFLGYSLTPFKRNYIFGDTYPQLSPAAHPTNNVAYRAHYFGAEAERLAAWTAAPSRRGLLLNYLLSVQPIPGEPAPPPSRIFSDGGAWFIERTTSPRALAGVLWNTRSSDPHSHKEVNSLNLVGYGEYLLRNAGYSGWKTGQAGFSWEYFFDRAISANTLLIDYRPGDERNPSPDNDHQDKAGAGIKEGLTTLWLDYACGASGAALPNGQHCRNLIFIHPTEDTSGYWIVVDDVETSGENSLVNVVFHPPSAIYKEISAEEEYSWTIKRYTDCAVNLTLYLATEPLKVEFFDGAMSLNYEEADSLGKYIASEPVCLTSKYIFSTYATENNKKSIITILIPSPTPLENPPPLSLERLKGKDYTGASFSHGRLIRDYIFVSEPDIKLECKEVKFPFPAEFDPNVNWEGKSLFYRLKQSGNQILLSQYFLREGRSFSFTVKSGEAVGFQSDVPLTICWREGQGTLLVPSPGARLSLFQSKIREVYLNDRAITPFLLTLDRVELFLPPGLHKISLVLKKEFQGTPF